MLSAQSQQKNYADKPRRELKFEAGDQVFLKVSRMMGVVQFDKKGKLNPWFCTIWSNENG